jgi:hypothetical protein
MSTNPDERCDKCSEYKLNAGGERVKLLRCTTCKIARYCSQACQRAAWPEHKKKCAPPPNGVTHKSGASPGACPSGNLGYIPCAELDDQDGRIMMVEFTLRDGRKKLVTSGIMPDFMLSDLPGGFSFLFPAHDFVPALTATAANLLVQTDVEQWCGLASLTSRA